MYLKDLEENPWINVVHHNDFPLIITKYNRACSFKKEWCCLTLSHRSVVYEVLEDKTLKQISFPFPKFFNIEENKFAPSWEDIFQRIEIREPYECVEKLDGHFVQAFFYDGKWILTSSGQFHTEMINYDYEFFNNQIKQYNLNKDYTYIFESISRKFPQTLMKNKFYIDGNYNEGLYLIGVRNNLIDLFYDSILIESSMIYNNNLLSLFPGYTRFDLKELKGLCEDPINSKFGEGFIIRFQNDNLRVKLKTAYYWSNRANFFLNTKKFKNMFITYGIEDLAKGFSEEYENKVNEFVKMYNEFFDEKMRYMNDACKRFSTKQDGIDAFKRGEIPQSYLPILHMRDQLRGNNEGLKVKIYNRIRKEFIKDFDLVDFFSSVL